MDGERSKEIDGWRKRCREKDEKMDGERWMKRDRWRK
ncbi:hypothetical protein A2U01_0038431, partial [Trifolium medium]|nr:hypothetical protein [Trifolium medium]